MNSKALEIETGNPLSYDWVSGGSDGNISEDARWAGCLKCFYTSGTIGCNVGAYGNAFAEILSDTFPSNGPVPIHLRQMVISSHIHALFSQVDILVRDSDLLPGPQRHQMSPDSPAYEFPTGDDTVRVLARKHRTDATWLITAWAAAGGNRNVSVYIPQLGNVTVEARIVSSVYTATLANGNVTLTRIDEEGATYTAVNNGPPVTTAVNLSPVTPQATNRVAWFEASLGVTADGAGSVSSWSSLGNGLTVTQDNAARRPTLVANAINGIPALRFVDGSTWLSSFVVGFGSEFVGNLTVFAVYTNSGGGGNKRIVSGVIPGGANFLGGKGFVLSNDIALGVQVKNGGGSVSSPLEKIFIGDMANNEGGGFGLNGDLAELLIYRNISSSTPTLINLYLADKYNIRGAASVYNGSFETPAVNGYRYNPTNEKADPNRPVWVFANGAILQANGSVWGAATAPNGSQTAVLQGVDGAALPTLSQVVNFNDGNYTVSFKAARRTGTVQPIRVMIDGNQVGGLITADSDAFADITTAQFSITSGAHVLRFEAVDGSGDRAIFLDQVVINQL